MGDFFRLVSEWLRAHALVDLAAEAAVLVLLLLVVLIGVAGTAYWLWWCIRLCRPGNVAKFLGNPIPGLRRSKLGSLELELAAGLTEADEETALALKALSERMTALEKSVKRLDRTMEGFEDVSGTLARGSADGHGT